ncbi:DUF6091 family protein [Alloalcanivorax xenomutans]|uniref:putative solute-binding protein n=1 Tax=Alloalcanivorax xenomutans TaxID=1094342 RepID=UPI003A7F852E
MKRTALYLLTPLLIALSLPTLAEPIKRKVCVFDIVGNAGPIMNSARDWKTTALSWGLDVELLPYTSELIATEDLKAGVCDAALVTGIRARGFNKFAGTIDAIGAVPSMDHLRIISQVLASPKMADKLEGGNYSVAGFAPAGPAYIFVNDRKINTLDKAAGKKVAVLEYDETQAGLVSQVGATPVDSDVTNFSTKFNNGSVDVIFAPLAVYQALELYKGLSPDGGIIDYPLVQLTLQVIAKTDRFPKEMFQKSRSYFYENFDRFRQQVEQESKAVDPKWWVKIPDEDKAEYELMMQEARDQLRDQGYYDPDMLTIMSKIRCKLDASRAECT